MKAKGSLLFGSLLAMALLAVPGVSSALPTMTFDLTSDHCTGGCLTDQANAGTITVTDLGGGSLSFDVTLANSNEFVSTGFQADFGFNLVGDPSITFSGVTTGFTPVATTAGSLHMDGTGFFEYGLDCTGCGSGGSGPLPGPLDFTITGAGLTLTSLEQNANGQFFAVDLISGTTGNTGGVDASVTSSSTGGPPSSSGGPVPEPGTLALLGLGLGLVALGRGRYARRA